MNFAAFTIFFDGSYLAELFLQIICTVAEQFRQIICTVAEQFRHGANYLTEPQN